MVMNSDSEHYWKRIVEFDERSSPVYIKIIYSYIGYTHTLYHDVDNHIF